MKTTQPQNVRRRFEGADPMPINAYGFGLSFAGRTAADATPTLASVLEPRPRRRAEAAAADEADGPRFHVSDAGIRIRVNPDAAFHRGERVRVVPGARNHAGRVGTVACEPRQPDSVQVKFDGLATIRQLPAAWLKLETV